MDIHTDSVLLTADMLAQYTYCPSRMHLMYVDGRWDSNLITDQGRSLHARTDEQDDLLPSPASAADEPEPVIARSVMLSPMSVKSDVPSSVHKFFDPISSSGQVMQIPPAPLVAL